ncbi:RNA polymerase sigma factor rpoS [Salmonella enterica subsp. arizonae]|uniref:RNA polymerase sigma factor rpoS n=1 Tax=Salmonella enterica subsp. arizonae TaxID=59203 RepID=A0A3S4GRW4_SALER|nr:RNA polymerase sigma factor rpoS [Salmonella enterica subsp. arizonae]
MSQNTLKVHDLNEDAEFDENGVEAFDEKALSEEEPSDNDLAEEELLSQGGHTTCVGRDSALPW